MTLQPNGNGNGRLKLTPATIGIAMAFLGQLIVTVTWAVHQEARITALESAWMDTVRRSEAADRQIEERSRTLEERMRVMGERIDRQETPLARRVDVIEARGLQLSSTAIAHETRINELFNLIRRPQ